jgi:hypothetical protein
MKKIFSVTMMLALSLGMNCAFSESYRIVKQNDLDDIDKAIESLKSKCNMQGDLKVTIDWDEIKPIIKSGSNNLHMARSCVTSITEGMERICTESGDYKMYKPDVEGIKAITVKKSEDGEAKMTYNCETKEMLTLFNEEGNCMGASLSELPKKFDDCE